MIFSASFNFLSVIAHNLVEDTKFKAFADKKSNNAYMSVSVYYSVENIMGKGENAGYKHFLLFLQCFQKASSMGGKLYGLCGKEVKTLPENFWKTCRKRRKCW